jgi:hypothetical protein
MFPADDRYLEHKGMTPRTDISDGGCDVRLVLIPDSCTGTNSSYSPPRCRG